MTGRPAREGFMENVMRWAGLEGVYQQNGFTGKAVAGFAPLNAAHGNTSGEFGIIAVVEFARVTVNHNNSIMVENAQEFLDDNIRH